LSHDVSFVFAAMIVMALGFLPTLFWVRRSGWSDLENEFRAGARPEGPSRSSYDARLNGESLHFYGWGPLNITLGEQGLYMSAQPSRRPLLIPWSAVTFVAIRSGRMCDFRFGPEPGSIFSVERPLGDEIGGFLASPEKEKYAAASAAAPSTWEKSFEPQTRALVIFMIASVFAIVALSVYAVVGSPSARRDPAPDADLTMPKDSSSRASSAGAPIDANER